MATKFYLPSTGAAAVLPSFTAGWEDSSVASKLRCVTTKSSSNMTSVSFSDANAQQRDICMGMWVSDAIPSQTISAQTITAQMRISETDLGNNLFFVITIKVVNNAGSSVTGTILALTLDGLEAATTLTNRAFSATSTQVVANANDRIVIEIGLSGDPANGKSHSGSISIGDNSASDLDTDDTTTTANNPFVNFANTITFGGVYTQTSNITETPASSIIKKGILSRDMSTTEISTFSKASVYSQSFSNVATEVATYTKIIGKVLSNTTTEAVSIVKKAVKALTIIETPVPTSLTKLTSFRAFSIPITEVVTFSKNLIFNVLVNITETVNYTVVKYIKPIISFLTAISVATSRTFIPGGPSENTHDLLDRHTTSGILRRIIRRKRH